MHWLPNTLTVLRLFLAPFIYFCIVRQEYTTALAVFFFAGFSDWLDGQLARRFDWHSRLGSLLDPVADKLLFLAAFLGLVFAGLMPLWLALLAIGRDIVIVIGATIYNFTIERLEGSASFISKLNTLVQGLYVLAILALAAFGSSAGLPATILSLVLCATIVASGLHYVWVWSAKARAGGRT